MSEDKKDTMGYGSRMHTKGVIEEKIKRLEFDINSLRVLRDNLNWDALTPEQESALWHFFICR